MEAGENIPQVFTEALDRKGASNPCPACSKNAWSVEKSGVATILIDGPEGVDLDDPYAITAFAAVCKNCGFIRLHSTRYLLNEDG
jgi:hypothetical protein